MLSKQVKKYLDDRLICTNISMSKQAGEHITKKDLADRIRYWKSKVAHAISSTIVNVKGHTLFTNFSINHYYELGTLESRFYVLTREEMKHLINLVREDFCHDCRASAERATSYKTEDKDSQS